MRMNIYELNQTSAFRIGFALLIIQHVCTNVPPFIDRTRFNYVNIYKIITFYHLSKAPRFQTSL